MMNVRQVNPSTGGTAEVHGSSNEDVKDTAGCSRLGSQCDMVGPKLKNNSESVEVAVQSQNFIACSAGSGYTPHELHQNKNAYGIPISSNGVNDTVCPRFEFSVQSEEGISLVVDLDSSPLDWIKKLNSGVCVHSKTPNKESHVLPHEVRDLESDDPEANASSLDDTMADCTNKDDPTFVNSLLDSTTVRECNHVKADSPDRSSRSTAVTQTKTPVTTSTGEKNQAHSSFCEANFEIHNSTNMLTKGSPRISDGHTLASQIKMTGDAVVHSKPDGSKSKDSLEHQSKSVATNVQQQTETAPVGISHLFSGWRRSLSSEVLKTLKPFTGIGGKGIGSNRAFSTNGNLMELHLSEAEGLREDMTNSPCQKDGAPNLENPTHQQNEVGKLAKCEFDLNKSLDPLSGCPEELVVQPRNNLINEAESSECSRSDVQAENCKKLDNSDFEERQNKRQHVPVDDTDSLASKRSRNAKNSIKESRPRRSMRLVSK